MTTIPVYNPSDTKVHHNESPPICTLKKKIFISIASVALVIFLLVYFFVTKEDLARAGIITIDEDPFDGEVFAWADQYVSSNGTLNIKILNSLEEKYDPYFNLSVLEWDTGIPDVLDFQVESAPYDSECKSRSGAIRVCNDNYGETGWEGLNTVLLRRNKIIASVAYMNDFYLDGSSDAKKEYTMCHELGHGFGLPHTDTQFFNLDEGNCMDYTSRKRNNRKPGSVSFNRLAVLYNKNQNSEGNNIGMPIISSLEKLNSGNISAEDIFDNNTEVLETFDSLCNITVHKNNTDEYEENEIGNGFKMIVHKYFV